MNTSNDPDNIEVALEALQGKCACYNIRKAARIVTQLYDTILEPSGLLGAQFGLLATIAGAGASNISRLAEMLGMDRTTLTRNLRPLERQGFIEMDAGLDRRTHIVRLTGQGRQALEAATPLWRRAQSIVLSRFGQARTAALLAELQALGAQIRPAAQEVGI